MGGLVTDSGTGMGNNEAVFIETLGKRVISTSISINS